MYMGREERGRSADGATDGSDAPSSESLDVVHELLASRRRRLVLYYLLVEGGTLQMSGLTNRLLEREYERPAGELPVSIRQRMHLDLYHTHVPKLDAEDVVEYCEDEGTVHLVSSDSELYTHLRESLDFEAEDVPDHGC